MRGKQIVISAALVLMGLGLTGCSTEDQELNAGMAAQDRARHAKTEKEYRDDMREGTQHFEASDRARRGHY